MKFLDELPEHTPVDLLAVMIDDPASPPEVVDELPSDIAAMIRRELERDRIRPGKGDTVLIPGGDTGPIHIALLGLGSEDDGRDEAVRDAGGRAARAARTLRASTLVFPGTTTPEESAWLVEGATLGSYSYKRFKTAAEDQTDAPLADPTQMRSLHEPQEKYPATVSLSGASSENTAAAQQAYALARATNWARDLANAPGNFLTPEMLAAEASALADQHEHLTCTVLDQADIEREGLGLIAAVGKGSEHEPRLIVLEWNPPGVDTPDNERLAFVGKAVTFDTGGISIKPSAGMTEMKLDKSGGCAVLGAMRAIAERNLQRRVVAVVGSAENMPGGRAYKPGDVFTARGGTTVEITNTDAEGRLVLGDSITWTRHLGCGAIVELSTLTGAMVVALGHHFSGVVARSSALTDAVLESAGRTGDPAWHLPMHDAYKDALKSECADLANSGPRYAGSLYAGLFLEHFAKDTPFAHIDIAGTAMLPKPHRYLNAKGASGWGVRLLADLAASYQPTAH